MSSRWMVLFGGSVLFSLIFSTLSAQDSLRIGVDPYKNPVELLETYTPMAEYLGEKLGLPAVVRPVELSQLRFALKQGELELGIFKPFHYLQTRELEEFTSLEVLATHAVYDTSHYVGCIVVRKESGISKLTDFMGKRFMFVKPTSTSGFYCPDGIFEEHNLSIDTLFSNYDFSGSHPESLQALFKRETEGIAIDKHYLDELSEEDRDLLKVIETYSLPWQAYVLSPALSPEFPEKIKNVMREAHHDPLADQMEIFENPFNITQWILCGDDHYNPLRRYVQIVRAKPTLSLQLTISKEANQSIGEDLEEIIRDNIIDQLNRSKRFRVVAPETSPNRFWELGVKIAQLSESHFNCRVLLNGKALETTEIKKGRLHHELPGHVISSVLNEVSIKTQLLTTGNGQDWFITYGDSDGINTQAYEFVANAGTENEKILLKEDVNKLTHLNTYFKPKAYFQKGLPMEIRHVVDQSTYIQASRQAYAQEGFWDNRDNQWGVIGLLVVLISAILGALFNRRKHRRFRGMLYQSNELLKDYMSDKYKIESRIVEQKERISRSLEKGYINENQYLILKHRVEDIQNIMQRLAFVNTQLPQQIEEEIQHILADGVITEKEYTRLVSIFDRYGKSEGGDMISDN